MEEHLKSIFSNVNGWLKFAEAKNGVLVAFNGSGIFVVLTGILLEDVPALAGHPALQAYFWSFIICLTVGLVIALFSFHAKLITSGGLSGEEMKPSDNLLYFDHIAKYDAGAYLERLSAALEMERKGVYGQLEKDYANEIIVNATIARRKYLLFNTALWCTIAGVMTPVLALLCWVVFRDAGDS